MEKGYKNLGYAMALLIPITFLGFFKTSYFVNFPSLEDSIDTILHFHFALASIWILLLITQPLLIKAKKIKLHKKLGITSYFVFPLFIISTVSLSINTINETSNFTSAYLPLADSVLLIVFFSLAIYNKKNTAFHMRYIIGTAFVFLGPTVGRIGPILLDLSSFTTQHILYAIIYLTLIILIIKDRRKGRIFLPYVIIITLFFLHQIGFYFE